MRPQAHSPEPNLPGLVFDSRRRTQYNYFRDFDPAIGRYVQSDPIGLEGGLNTYGYAFGNPMTLVDATGLDVGFGRQGSIGGSFAVPIIGRVLGFGGGGGLTLQQCCGNDGLVYNELYASARFGVSVGASAQATASPGRGLIPLGRAGALPKCLFNGDTEFFNGIDFAAGPLTVRIRKSRLDVGLTPGTGGSATLNLFERKWPIWSNPTPDRCECRR